MSYKVVEVSPHTFIADVDPALLEQVHDTLS